MFWQTTVSPTAAQAANAATAAADAWNTHLAPFHSTAITLTEVTLTDLTSSSAEMGTWSGAHAGTRVGQPTSAPVSTLVNMTVHRRYRGGKPRIYVPAGAVADFATPQTWTPTFLSGFGTAFETFLQSVIAGMPFASPAATLVNVAYWQGHHWVPPDSTPSKKVPLPYPGGPHVDVITGFRYNPLIGTQRRRIRPG
jgi:hypothetical protein